MKTAIPAMLVLMGVLLIFAPVGSYYFGTYTHSRFKGAVQDGSRFEYYGIVGSFWDNSSHQEFMLGISMNITKSQPKDEYVVEYSIYRLIGQGQLNVKRSPHFIAQKVTLEWRGNITANESSPVIEQLFPERLANITEMTHTFPDHFYGYPKVYVKNKNYYIKYSNTYAALGVSPDSPCSFIETVYPKGKEYCSILFNLYGNRTQAEDSLIAQVDLAGGNTVPPQDWRGWIRYGFGWSFPVNTIFILLGLIVYIMTSREGRM